MSGRGSLFFASLSTETNSFSGIPTRYEDFAAEMRRGESVLYGEDGDARPDTLAILNFAESRGLTVVPSLCAAAPPGAPTDDDAYHRLRDEILNDLRAASDVRAVLLGLHGAMMAQSCTDCEGDILAQVRLIVGSEVPVVAVLDPHAHLTARMVESADFLVFMKEYPHTDGLERTAEALDVIAGLLDGSLTLAHAVHNCELLGFFPTNRSPMREFVDGLFDKEQDPDVVSVSFIHGFPWGDTLDVGAKVLVYTRGDAHKAKTIASATADEIKAIRDRTMFPTLSVDEAIDAITPEAGDPVVFGDISDNPGGGAPGDSTFILEALLREDVRNVAVGCLYDPASVAACHEAGVGNQVQLSLGGKVDEHSGQPVSAMATVKGVAKSASMNVADIVEFPMGDTAWVSVRGIDVVLMSTRTQTYAPHALTHLGVDLHSKDAIFVKSTNHFQAFFDDIASEIHYVNTPGAIDYDLTRVPYRVFDKPYYPRSSAA